MNTLARKYSFDEVFDAQRVYRAVLTAMSNPARVVDIGDYADRLCGEHPEMLALALTFLNNESSFFVFGDGSLANDIALLTRSPKIRAEGADYLFVTEPGELDAAIGAAKFGTLRDPHKSATLIVANAGRPSSRMRLVGPGIKNAADLHATDTVARTLALRDARNYEYPQGVDFIFVSENGELFALPRLVRKEAK